MHFPTIQQELLSTALEVFFDLRETPNLKKKPSTSELLDWLKLLLAEDLSAAQLREHQQQGGLMPMFGALLKNEQDTALVEKLAFISRRQGR